MIYVGAEEIISPLGGTVEENFSALVTNRSGISKVPDFGVHHSDVNVSKMFSLRSDHAFEDLVAYILVLVGNKMDENVISSKKTVLIISSTKGDLNNNITDPFGLSISSLMVRFDLKNQPVVISNACISGVMAINAASNFIRAGLYDHAIVIGCDVISDFIVYGFQSLFAMSDLPCTPFDANRKGISIGEGSGAVVVSNTPTVFKDAPLKLLPGTSANDANHISGPSRTGEGLYRTVKKTMEINQICDQDIDFISAHGTGTIYNDEMESIAFDRLNLSKVPLNSLKGYFGHTLGAAGVIETAASMQMMREGILIKSWGFTQSGTSRELNVIRENKKSGLHTILKTASGFGGGNASLIIQKL